MVEQWLEGPLGRRPAQADAWQAALHGSLLEITELLGDAGERARELRQSTPFAGALEPRERWAIWRAVPEEEEGRVAAGTADPRATRHLGRTKN